MKVDQLMEAIEHIDDRYIEEGAYGVRRKSNIPWGMIITAACFCLAIGATIFMQSLGILPHLNGPSSGTSQPVTTEPSNTTEPPETSRPVDDAAVQEEIMALFNNRSGWYYRALVDEFDSPRKLHLRYYFYNSTEFGEGLQPTKEEMDELMAWEDYQEGKTLTILPVSKMDAVLTEVFGITVAEMEGTAFAGLKYVESIDSWCFWGIGTQTTPEVFSKKVEKIPNTENLYKVTIRTRYARYNVCIRLYEDSYYIEYNRLIESTVPPTEPPETTPPETRPSVEELFCDRGSWHNIALASFKSPQEIYLGSMFSRTYSGEPVVLTDYEQKALKELLDGAGAGQITRYTAEQIDEILLLCFNKSAEELGVDLESHFTYLKETTCYYGLYWGTPGVSIENVRTEECEDGTVNLYFTYGYDRVAKLQPHDTGYYILSTEKYVDNTGKSEDQIAMEALFRDPNSWFNRAIACEYDSPKEMSLIKFFYGGFKGEPQKPTDQEREQLENLGINLNYDLMRLPVDKMNEVLTEYFGITLADMEPEAFGGLVYLESTNCYYHSTSGWLGVENFEALSVQRMDDGRILVQYPYMNEEYVVTLMPHGDGYQVLSNVLADPFRPYAVDAAELNALLQEVANGNLTEERKKEILLPLLGTFLEDPDLFVSGLLAQQKSQMGVLEMFASTVKYLHPRYSAYNQTISAMMEKIQTKEEKQLIYWMAYYSGLYNFLPQEPDAQDYTRLFDMALYSDAEVSESCAFWMLKYCKVDPKGFIEALALTDEEYREDYADLTVSDATREELRDIKGSMELLVKELLSLDRDEADISDQIECAMLIIASCDGKIK